MPISEHISNTMLSGMSSSKRKGDRYERELAAYFNESCGLSSSRTPLSGGGRLDATPTADLLGTPLLHIEAKRVERLNFHEALAQAERNRDRSGADEMAVVVNRRSRQTTGERLCLLRLDDLLTLYRYCLQAEGFVKGVDPDEGDSTTS